MEGLIPTVNHPALPRLRLLRYTLQQRGIGKDWKYFAGHALRFCGTCFVNIGSQVTAAIRNVVGSSCKHIIL